MTLDLLLQSTVYLFVFLFPLFFLPFTPDSYEYNKMAFMIFFCIIILLILGLNSARKKKIVFVRSSFDLPLFFLAGASLVSAVFQSPNWAVALTTPLTATALTSGFILYFLLIHLKIDELGKKLMQAVVFSSFFVALYTILLYAGVIPKNAFTPAGTLLATAVFLSVITVYLLSSLLSFVLSQKKNNRFSFSSLIKNLSFDIFAQTFALLVVGGTAVLVIIHLFTDQKPVILPFSLGWIIFVETLKNIKTLLLGVGPANFIAAFTLTKPPSFNLTPYWSVIFTGSSSYFLNIATEIGIIAAASFLIILIKSIRFLLKETNSETGSKNLTGRFPFILTLAVALILQVILPGNMTVFILTIILLAITAKKWTAATLSLSRYKRLPYYLFILSIAPLAAVSYFASRAYLAETYFKKALDAMVNNQGDITYLWLQKAIALNPYLDRYHLAFSKTNFALANSLAAKKEPTDEDKKNIPVLIKQAIDEGRTAVFLFQTNVNNWDNLAATYASIINIAQGAEEFALQSYRQRIALYPNDPNGYLDYGGLFLSLKKLPEAEASFRTAVNLKPDLPNAHYNLAVVLLEQKRQKEAYEELKIVASLLPSDSEDSKKVKKEMEELEKLLPKEETTPAASLKKTENGAAPADMEIKKATPSSLKKLPSPIPTISLAAPEKKP
jgi:tetratricopeptide (TPR) repeat protein